MALTLVIHICVVLSLYVDPAASLTSESKVTRVTSVALKASRQHTNFYGGKSTSHCLNLLAVLSTDVTAVFGMFESAILFAFLMVQFMTECSTLRPAQATHHLR